MKNWFNTHKKTIAISALIIVLCTILIGLLFAIRVMFNLKDAEKESYHPTDSHRYQNVKLKNNGAKDNLSFLVLGMDKLSQGTQRTDSIIIATYNVKTNVITMSRIPRDLYIKTDKYEGKINALYESEGLSETINTIQDYVGIPISNYATTDFNGLTKIIDKVGGIDINSDIKIDKSNNENLGGNIQIKKGKNHLNGKEALGYSRIRYIDNDIERGNRQMEVIDSLVHQMTKPSQLASADENVKFISKYVKTDMKISDAIDYILDLKSTPKIKKLTFKWDQTNINGTDYVTISRKERANMSNQLRENLNLKKDAPLAPIAVE